MIDFSHEILYNDFGVVPSFGSFWSLLKLMYYMNFAHFVIAVLSIAFIIFCSSFLIAGGKMLFISFCSSITPHWCKLCKGQKIQHGQGQLWFCRHCDLIGLYSEEDIEVLYSPCDLSPDGKKAMKVFDEVLGQWKCEACETAVLESFNKCPFCGKQLIEESHPDEENPMRWV